MKKKQDNSWLIVSVVCFMAVILIAAMAYVRLDSSVKALNARVDEYGLQIAKLDSNFNKFGEEVVNAFQQQSYVLNILAYRSLQLENATGIDLGPLFEGLAANQTNTVG